MATENELVCSKCKLKVEANKIVLFSSNAKEFECFDCWKIGIDKKKVEELRKQLGQYIKCGKNEPKEGLSETQLSIAKRIIKDNYFGESDQKSKEILNAMVFMSEESRGESIDKCLKKIDQEMRLIEIRLKLASEPRPKLKTYTLKCLTCGKEFSCELEKSLTSKEEADDILKEQLNKHVKKFHKPREREKEHKPKETEPSEDKKKDKNIENSSSANIAPDNDSQQQKNLLLLLTVVTIILFFLGGTIAYLRWKKKHR